MFVSRSEKKLGTWSWLFHCAGLSVAIAECAVILVLVIWPIDNRHAEVQRKTVDLRRILDRELDVRHEHQRLSQSLSAADEKIDGLLNRIPNLPREADFLGQITTLAREVGLEIVDYRPGGTTERGEYQEMIVTLSSEGSYSGLCSFLQRIHHLPRLSRVNELKISPRQDGQTYSLNMTLAIYFAPKNKLAGMGPEVSNG